MTSSKKPNLFLIGAMKSGTTSLHNYLNNHPNIFMCEPKEPGFFAEEIAWDKGLKWYENHFLEANEQHQYLGESSTYYTKLPTHQKVIDKLYDYCPEAKLIYVMRHPFKRIVSHYWHDYRQLQAGGIQKSIYETCTNDPMYIQYSDYAMQLNPYIERYGIDRIYLLTFEELISEPLNTTLQVCEWLGLSDNGKIDWTSIGQKHNDNPEQIKGIKPNMHLLNAIRYSSLWDKISRLVPKSLRKIMTNAVETKTTTSEQATETEQLRQEFIPEMRRIIADISELTGTDYSKVWKL